MSSFSSGKVLSTMKAYYNFWMNEFDDGQSFYLMVLGFLLFQFVTDFISKCAALYSIPLEIILRVFFFFIQTGMLFLAEGGVTQLQLRILLTIWFNSGIKACSIAANPIETLIVISIASWPVFDYYDNQMRNPD